MMKPQFTVRALLCFVLIGTQLIPAFAQALRGKFVGQVVVKWLQQDGPDRDVELMEKFEYIDSSGKRWTVEKGAIVNGASIPQPLWQFGSPFTGDYRMASVIHDVYCERMTESWQATHRMFYEAMLDAGMSERNAKVMYAGVYWGGPRWEKRNVRNADGTTTSSTLPLPADEPTPEDLKSVERWIDNTRPSLVEIEAEMERRRVIP
jgi:hypothetical protein